MQERTANNTTTEYGSKRDIKTETPDSPIDVEAVQDRLMTLSFRDGFNSGYHSGVNDAKSIFLLVCLAMVISAVIMNRVTE